ncbi:MAG: hypothetical protein ACYDBH_25020 [Acidobacteriaceae bacterium]
MEHQIAVQGSAAVVHPSFITLLRVLQALLFDGHIGEFVRVEDLAAFQTFDKFSVFFARDDAHTWVFAGFHG